MAVLKTIPIHDTRGIKNAVDYVTDEEKTTVDEDISTLLTYAENIKKTAFELDGEKSVLVSGFNCNSDNAPEEFWLMKLQYEERLRARGIEPESRIYGKKAGKGKHEGELVDKEAREAYHIIMSFPKRSDLSPQMVHKIGLEFCEKAFPDTKAVVSTHMNTDNLHNHIVRSAYNISTATKYRDTVENLERLREINDELSLKYGLEIILDRNMSDRKGYSWYETNERENGRSWKDVLKDDIKRSIALAHSWEEYKNIMTQSGYGITEKGKTVVYYFLNDENRRIRENKLGTDYTREHIRELFGEKEPKIVPYTKKSQKKSALKAEECFIGEGSAAPRKKSFNLFVSRYTLTGRRRSDLELIFLAAIKLINYFKDSNLDTEKAKIYVENPVYQPHYLKLKTMQESLNMTLGLGIRDAEHLGELKRQAGAKLSAKQAELRSMEINLSKANELSDMVKDIKIIKDVLEKKGLSDIDFKILEYSKKDIRENLAKFNPMTSLQRRELYTKLSDSEYRVTVKYDSISYKEGQAILDFLSGKTDKRPEILVTEDEYTKHQRVSYYQAVRRKRDQKSKDRYEGSPVSEAQLKAIDKIREKHPDYTYIPKNMYEASQIIAFFNAKNPFGAELADKESVDRVILKLSEKGLSLNREHITVSEVKDIEAYLDGRLKMLPNVLKPQSEMKNYQVDRLTELMSLKGVTSSVEVSEMSLDDYYRFYDYLLNLNEVPDVMKENVSYDTEEDIKRKNNEFEQSLLGLPSDDQGLLYRYRVILNDLSSMGYSEESFDMIIKQGLEIADTYNKLKQEASDYRWEYRNYSHLEWNMNLAKNTPYTKGAGYEKPEPEVNKEFDIDEDITIEDSPDVSLSKEDDNITDESIKKSGARSNLNNDMFSISDYYN